MLTTTRASARTPTEAPAMRLRRLLPPLLLGAALAGCTDLNLTNPNALSSGNFWRTQNDALQGINATYNGLMNNGTYGRWLVFATDLRADDGRIQSPWTDLSNFTKFSFTSYDFEVNRELWIHHYQALFRANQVIARVPSINMDATLRDRIVGEAKFIRALLYFNLVNLYGNVPLITAPPVPTDRPASATPAQIYAQIEQDLNDAIGVLPVSYTGADVGRATKGAAQALLGKALAQQAAIAQPKWAEAATMLGQVISSGQYQLMQPVTGDSLSGYAANFVGLPSKENNAESIFEVQFGDRSTLANGVRGLNIARMVGPCGPSYCDGRPTRWFFNQFFPDTTNRTVYDPRLDYTMYWNRPGGMAVYNIDYQTRYPGSDEVYWKKWGEYYLGATDQDWDAAINFRVIRYADVLLLHAEALNEASGPSTQVYDDVNQVRRRVGLADLPAGLSQAQMRDAIMHERLLELGLEGQRMLDLARHDMVHKAILEPHDAEFQFFRDETLGLLPIPQTEIDLNPNVRQNPGW